MLRLRTKILLSSVGIVVAGIFMFGILQWLGADLWPPAWLERQTQRRTTLERVEKSGGWDTLHAECKTLSEHATSKWQYIRQDQPILPPVIRSLGAYSVAYGRGEDNIPVVHINLYGGRHISSPWHDPPLYDLLVICSPTSPDWKPKQWTEHYKVNKLADSVFEMHD